MLDGLLGSSLSSSSIWSCAEFGVANVSLNTLGVDVAAVADVFTGAGDGVGVDVVCTSPHATSSTIPNSESICLKRLTPPCAALLALQSLLNRLLKNLERLRTYQCLPIDQKVWRATHANTLSFGRILLHLTQRLVVVQAIAKCLGVQL